MRPMLLKDFFQMFPDEDSCENYLRAVREEIGVVCPKCGATKYKWLPGRKSFQCELEYYSPAWLMMMKLREIMGQRDSIYTLSDDYEAYFESV